MPFLSALRVVPAALALALSALAIHAAASDGPKKYSFRTPPVNSLGLKSLADLRGRPVLVDFWGTR
jgi:hypothetical protein